MAPRARPSAALLQTVATCGPGQAAVMVLNDTLHNGPDCAPSLLDALRYCVQYLQYLQYM